MEDLLIYLPVIIIILYYVSRRVPCPACGATMPTIYPVWQNTRRQWIEGGYVCRECGCEADWNGKKIMSGTPIRPAYKMWGTAFILFGIGIGLILYSRSLTADREAPPPRAAMPPVPPPVALER